MSAGFPIISFKGKVWHIVRGGVPELVTNSENEPRASLDVVIIKANPDLIFLADTLCCKQSQATVAARAGWSTMAAVTPRLKLAVAVEPRASVIVTV